MFVLVLLAAKIAPQGIIIQTPTGITIQNEQLRDVCAKYGTFHLVLGDNQGADHHLIQLFYGGPNCTIEVWSTALKLKPLL